MVFVITHEDIVMPMNLCGTVYTKNNLAMAGILALNAGHVDPGYDGPIVIRLINIRSIPWVLKMGDPIFTIVFQSLNYEAPVGRPAISANDMLKNVETSASESLSNALYDIYANEIRQILTDDFISRKDFWRVFFAWLPPRIWYLITALAVLAGVIFWSITVLLLGPTLGFQCRK